MNIIAIFRDENYFIEEVRSVKYVKNKFDCLNDLELFFENTKKIKCLYYKCDFDDECKKKYYAALAQKRGMLSLDTDFNNLTFTNYYKLTKNSNLIVNVSLVGGGLGDAPSFSIAMDVIQIIFKLFILFIKMIIFIKKYNNPYRTIEKEYKCDKQFFDGIILYNECWKRGFLKLDIYKYPKIIEKKLMKKIGYELRGNVWIPSCDIGVLRRYNNERTEHNL